MEDVFVVLLELNEVDSLALEQIRSELNKLLIETNYFSSPKDFEDAIKKLIVQLDDIQYAQSVIKKQELFPLEPVNINEVTEQLINQFTKDTKYTNINFQYRSKFSKPVLAHRKSLLKSLESMTRVVLDTESDDAINVKYFVTRKNSIARVGVFSSDFAMEAKHLNQFKEHIISSSRPTSMLSPLGITNIFIANALLKAMGMPLMTSIRQGNRGLATALSLSKQLRFIDL